MDAVAQLSAAIRRLADEPDSRRRALASLTELLAANYLFFSSLASMPILVKLRETELDASAGAKIEAARGRVMALLLHKPLPSAEAIPSSPQPSMAMAVLARRLSHIEQAAGKVLRLAARLE
jgi:hypothetical protein